MIAVILRLKFYFSDDDDSLNETNESPEMLETQVDILEDSDVDQNAEQPSYVGSLANQIVYVLDESGNLIPHRATRFVQENSSDSENTVIKQPNELLACNQRQGKQIQLENKDAEKSLENSVDEAHDKVESEGNTAKKNSTSSVIGESEDDQPANADEIIVAVHGNNGETQRTSKSGSDKQKNAAAQLGEAERSIEGNGSRELQNDVSKMNKKSSKPPLIVKTFKQLVDPVHNYSKVKNAVQKDSDVRARPKQIVRFRKRKILGKNRVPEKQAKRRVMTVKMPNQAMAVEMPNQAGTSSECEVGAFKSCNAAFSMMLKDYLDKITAPDKLSATRLQILTILHNELYSTYS